MTPDQKKAKLAAAQDFLVSLHALTAARCVIAGGFVRDTIMGVEHRDVDIYCPEEAWDRVQSHTLYDTPKDQWEAEESEAYIHQSISLQYEADVLPILALRWPVLFKGHKANIIGLNDHADCSGPDIVSRFNFGICQAWLDYQSYGVSEAFKSDVRNKQITLLRTDWGREASERQYEKLRQKYPWPMVECTSSTI
jgi:hypothetical protein